MKVSNQKIAVLGALLAILVAGLVVAFVVKKPKPIDMSEQIAQENTEATEAVEKESSDVNGVERETEENETTSSDMLLGEDESKGSEALTDPVTGEEYVEISVPADLKVVYRSLLTDVAKNESTKNESTKGDATGSDSENSDATGSDSENSDATQGDAAEGDVTAEKQETELTNTKVLSYTCDQLYIYSEATPESEVVGILYSVSEATLVEKGEVYSLITSGSVTGYVRNVDVLFGDEAQLIADNMGVALSTAKSVEEIRAEEAAAEQARKDAEEAAKREEQNTSYEDEHKNEDKGPSTQWRGAYQATDEEVHLLATIIYYEAGWEPTEGQLAVANVVLNRIYSKEFAANTMAGVIYSPGQFYGVADNGGPSELFKNSYLNKSNEELNKRGCYDVAIRALNGENNIEDYCFFISVGKADYGKYKKYRIINNHCFYEP